MASNVNMIRELSGKTLSHGVSINSRMIAADDALRRNDMPSFYTQAGLLMQGHGFSPETMDSKEFMAHYQELVEGYHFRDY